MHTRQKQCCSIPQNSSIHLCLFRSAKPRFSFSNSVRNLGFYLDKDTSMEEHINFICKTAFLEIRRISTICHYLTDDATKTLIVCLVLSRMDYCNALLAGFPQSLVSKLQRVQNSCLVVRAPPHVHVTPVPGRLHRSPVRA